MLDEFCCYIVGEQVLTRGSNNPDDDAYRERTMTLNGKIVAKGAPSRGDRTDSDIQNGRKRGTESYLLPWIWDSETGKKVAADKEKLYHCNCCVYKLLHSSLR